MYKVVEIEKVKVLGGHRLFLRFVDGVEGELDFGNGPWNGVFAPLEDPDYFARVEVDKELGTIGWPNGADVAPDSLYLWVSERRTHAPA
ncbi:MAG TPA: DUF2442 domain-containing protein [Solirubrobacterales bacterium]